MEKLRVVLAIICPSCKRVKKNKEWIYLTAADWLRIRQKYVIDESQSFCPDCQKLGGGDYAI